MDHLALFWFYGDSGRRSIWAPNWLEALGHALGDTGLPSRMACEVSTSGRVLVQDLDRDRMYMLVPQGVSLLDTADANEPAPIASVSATGYG